MLALWLSMSVGWAEPGEYQMNNLGGAVVLPAGWELVSGGWSDDGFKTIKLNKHVDLQVWFTDYQVPITAQSAQDFAEMHKDRFDKQGGVNEARVVSAEVQEIAGRATAVSTLGAKFQDSTPVTAVIYSFPSGGQTIHIRAMGREQFAEEVRADVRMIAEAMKLDAPALEGVREVSAGQHFAATLPEGWRRPFEKELPKVQKLTAKMGEPDLPADRCFVGIRPAPAGDPGVLFACGSTMRVGPVDEYSFAGVEQEVHAEYFGSAPEPVPAATQVQVGDRLGFYYAPREGLRLALAPYDQGMMVTWGMASGEDAASLDAALKATLADVKFTGPEGGQPVIGPDRWAMHYLRYRPTSPPVLLGGLLLLGVVGGAAWLMRRGGRPRPDLDDE